LNCILDRFVDEKIKVKIRVKGKEEKDVRSYWISLTKREDVGN